MGTKKSNLKSAALFTGALLAGTAGFTSANEKNNEMLSYSSLGSGSELRSELLELNKGVLDASKALNNENIVKFSELKCGEGKCGEGKCGEDKKSEKKDKKKDEKKEGSKEGKTETTSESKSDESSCGAKEESKAEEVKE